MGGLEVAREVLEMVLTADEAVAPVPEKLKLEPTPDTLRRFLGYYHAEPGINVNVEYRDSKLQLAAHSASAYSLHAPAELESTDKTNQWRVRGRPSSRRNRCLQVRR